MKILDKEIIVNSVGILTATDMVVSINYDDLKSKAELNISLRDSNDREIVSCAYKMEGVEYSNWDGSELYAYQKCANYLKIEIQNN
jgi:hypothetical protein